MNCPECGLANDQDAQYCENCGSILLFACLQCGNPIKPGANFCKKCGAPVPKEPQSLEKIERLISLEPIINPSIQEQFHPASTRIEGERKPVTILFADIVDSTSIAEMLDPEEWKKIISGVHQRLSQVINRYEGTIAQLLGDGVLVFFGAPVTHEDDPLRAVRAGLDIQKSIDDFGQTLEGIVDSFQVRIGIHTGTVIVGNVGTDQHTEYLAIGDAVNLAARLQSVACPGTVLISDATARLVKGACELEPLETINLKGRVRPVPVYEAISVKAAALSNREMAQFSSPLVGREVELGNIMKPLTSLQAGCGQIVAVVGEAGIGKTRLVDEAHKALVIDDQLPQIRWLTGRALSFGQALSFWTINQFLKDDLGLSDGDPETRIKTSLNVRIQELFGEQSNEVLPYLTHLMGVRLEDEQAVIVSMLDGETLKRQTLFAIREYFLRLAQQQPLVLVFEDFHWADPSTLEALESLMALTNRHRLLIFLLARPERDHGSWRIKIQAETDYEHRYTGINLQPLSLEEQSMMVGNLLQTTDLPETIRQLILERSEGNPFYLEEIVHNLIEQGAIVYQAGHWKTTQAASSRNIPDTLQGILLSRIDRLQEDVRRTLQLASVIGKSFLYRLLEAIVQDEGKLDDHLAQLQRLDLVREKTRQPELEYIFKHSLTQQAAYNSLLLEQRKEFHHLVAEAMERLFPDREEEFCGLLAIHYYTAGDHSKALEHLIQAGKQAKAHGAYLEASQYLNLALELLPQNERDKRWQVLLDRDEAWGGLGMVEERLASNKILLEFAHELNDDSCLAEAYLHVGSADAMMGHFQDELKSYQESLIYARRSGNRRIEALTLGSMTDCNSRLGDMLAAGKSAEDALALAKELGDDDVLVRNLTNASVYYTAIGDHSKSIQLISQQVSINQRRGNRFGEALGLINLGYSYASLGQYQQSVDTTQRSIDILDRIGARTAAAYGRLNLGLSYLRCGNTPAAFQQLENAISDLQAAQDAFGIAAQRAYYGLALERSSDRAGAETCFEEAKGRFHESGALGYEVDAVAGLARCKFSQGDLSGANHLANQVWEYLEQNDPSSLEFPILSFISCAEIFSAVGETEKANTTIEAGYSRLITQADRISDSEWRKSFLENVPEHNRLIEIYSQIKT